MPSYSMAKGRKGSKARLRLVESQPRPAPLDLEKELIGERLRAAQERAHITSIPQLVARMPPGTDQNQVYKWMGGKVRPSLVALAELARALDCSLDYLVFGERQPPALAELAAWLEKDGRDAPQKAREWLAKLPLDGYRPGKGFYDTVYNGWKNDLEDLGLDAAAQQAIDQDRLK